MYDRLFNALAVVTFAGALFIANSLPLLFDDTEAEAQTVEPARPLHTSFCIDYKTPEIDTARAFELKEAKDKALANINSLAALYELVDSIEVKWYVKKYAGVFYCTKYAATVEQCGNADGWTASGKKVTTDPTCWTVAVDPAVIPLGTKLVIEGYEGIVFEATDTGSAINGNDIDIFTESESESKSFNPCYLSVWIVEF